jgi:exopolysaccharide production protein ExoQ
VSLVVWQKPVLQTVVILEAVTVALAVYLSSYRAFIFTILHPGPKLDEFYLEPQLWSLTVLLAGLLLVRERQLPALLSRWRQCWWLAVLPLLALVSVLWSPHPLITANRAIILLMATTVASVIGLRNDSASLLRGLGLSAVAMLLTSVYLVYADPLLGTSLFYKGAWRGIFWHKNHLGPLAALASAVFLLQLIDRIRHGQSMELLPCIAFYLLALGVVFGSHSAAALFLLPLLHLVVLIGLFWLRWADQLMTHHYRIGILLAVLLGGVLVINLESLFGLVNKDITLTGRTKLWVYLLTDFVAERPWFGYGFNALWGDGAFRQLAYARLHFFPVIGDNGFLDILLGLGAVGLAAFLLVYLAAWRRAFLMINTERSVVGLLPLLLMVFSLLANISFSYLLEIDFLVWGLLVVILFMQIRFPFNRPSVGESRAVTSAR